MADLDYEEAAKNFLDMDESDLGESSATTARLAALRKLQGAGLLGLAPGLHTEKQGQAIADEASSQINTVMKNGPENRLLKLSLGQAGLIGKGLTAQTRADASKYGVDVKDKEFYAKLAQAKLLADQHEAETTHRTAMTVYGGDKADQSAEKMFNDLSPYKNPKLNVLQQNIDRGDAVDALFKQGPGGLTQAQQAEAAQGVARLIGGSGRIAQQQIEHMIPKTLWQDSQKLWEYLSNNPQILKNKDFMDIMAATLQREKIISQQKIHDEQTRALSAHANFIRNKPEDAARIARGFGLQIPDEYYGGQPAPVQAPPPVVPPAQRPVQRSVQPPQAPPQVPAPVVQPPVQAPLLKQTLGGGQPVKITSKAEYDALPHGTKYIGPSGKLATKP